MKKSKSDAKMEKMTEPGTREDLSKKKDGCEDGERISATQTSTEGGGAPGKQRADAGQPQGMEMANLKPNT